MSRDSNSLKLLRILNGSYIPRGNEVLKLAEVARLNKLYLAYLRALGDVLRSELAREEARYKWFVENTVEVVKALRGINYALYKFRRPVDHVSVDLDILIAREDVPRAVKTLLEQGFRIVVSEPYTVTLVRNGFIVDLYTEPSFAWIVYMSGSRLLREYTEEVEINGINMNTLTREAEVVITAAHAVYKEHMVLLMDCLVLWNWLDSRAWSIAIEHSVEKSLQELQSICGLVEKGLVETPYKLKPHTILKTYIEKTIQDPVFRITMPNVLKYILSHRDIGLVILKRLTRKSY